MFVAMMSTFMLPVLIQPTSYGGDPRGGDTSVSEQLIHIFSHPWTYTKLLLSSIWKTFNDYTVGVEGNWPYGAFAAGQQRSTAGGTYCLYGFDGSERRRENKTGPVAERCHFAGCVLCAVSDMDSSVPEFHAGCRRSDQWGSGKVLYSFDIAFVVGSVAFCPEKPLLGGPGHCIHLWRKPLDTAFHDLSGVDCTHFLRREKKKRQGIGKTATRPS